MAQGGATMQGWVNMVGEPNPAQTRDALNLAHGLISILKKEVDDLKGELQKNKGNSNKKDLKELKSFMEVPVWDGAVKGFSDYEFKLHQFVDSFLRFEAMLDYVKNLENPPTETEFNWTAQQEFSNHGVDLHWMNSQLFSALSLKTSGDPLQLVKSVRELTSTRGVVAWHKMTRDVANNTGVCLERLSDRVHHPKKITDYKDALVMLHKWDADRKELKKLAQQELAELTLRATLKSMIPEDLKRDIEKDENLKEFSKSWDFVLKQVPLRKEWKKKAGSDMDIGLAEKTEDQKEDEPEEPGCQPCTDQEGLFSMKGQKGGSSQPFQGYCSYCWAWGHKRMDCRKRMAQEGTGKGADPKGASGSKGDEKGKSFEKGGKGGPSGGWQPKGGKGFQKGKGKRNFGGKNGLGGGRDSCIWRDSYAETYL